MVSPSSVRVFSSFACTILLSYLTLTAHGNDFSIDSLQEREVDSPSSLFEVFENEPSDLEEVREFEDERIAEWSPLEKGEQAAMDLRESPNSSPDVDAQDFETRHRSLNRLCRLRCRIRRQCPNECVAWCRTRPFVPRWCRAILLGK